MTDYDPTISCPETVKLLSQYIEPALAYDNCADIYDRFNSDASLIAIPVLEGDKPIGLLKRTEFMERLADRFGRPLYSKQPATTLMDVNALMVDSSVTVTALNQKIVTKNKEALKEGFIVIEDGKYLGVGSALTLIQANMLYAEKKLQALHVAREAAEAASEAKSAFLANMSHELRTPLNAVIGFSDLILDSKIEDIKCPTIIDYITDINSSGTHLLGMINTILDMSRIESGKYDLVENDEDPHELIDQAIRIMSPKALSKNIEIIKCLHDFDVSINVDAQLMKQILINLLSNAVKFSPEGSNVFVSLLEEENGSLSIIVQDEGPGVPKQMISEIVKPFTQLDGVLVRNHEGTGLGLPLVVAFTEAHGGVFHLHSEDGEGLTATVTLPAGRANFLKDVSIGEVCA